jgi:hypothetical protein
MRGMAYLDLEQVAARGHAHCGHGADAFFLVWVLARDSGAVVADLELGDVLRIYALENGV